MSQDCSRPVVCERDKDSRREFLSIKDYSKLNSLPSFSTIFRKPGSKSRNAGKSDSDSEDVYVHCITTVTNAVAEEVRFNTQGKRFVVDQQNFLIPLEYDGWFEVLSQDGRSTRPIETVKELSSLEAQSSFLVRQSIKGYRQTGDRAFAVEVIREGIVLKTHETLLSSARQIASSDSRDIELIKGPLLKCLDSQGGQIYMALDARGLFSPLACRSRIVGAHDIRSLLEKFRLPVLVRLIHGNISESAQYVERASKIFRLIGKCSEELAFVLLLNNPKTSGKDARRMLPLPANEKYLLSPLKTMDGEEMKCLQKNCALHISNFKNAIRLDSSPPHKRHWLLPPVRAIGLDFIQRNQLNSTDNACDNSAAYALSREEQQLFREIEDLYAAVRNPRHPQTIQTLRLQRQGHAEETTKFPKNFKISPFSNEPFAGRPVLFSRNLVFHGNLEKLNLKQTNRIRNEFDKRSPAIESLRFAKTSNKDQTEGSKMRPSPGTMSLHASKENLYAEIASLRPCNAAEKESQWAHSTLSKHKLELVKAPRGADTEKTNKSRILNNHDAAGNDKQKIRQRNALIQNNCTSANTARDWKDSMEQLDIPDHNTKATVFKDKVPLQRENCSHPINDQMMTPWDTRPVLLQRPKSYAGTPHADRLLTAFLGPVTTQKPAQSPAPSPPLPPRRVASLTEVNVLSELQHGHGLTPVSTSSASNHLLRPDQRRLSTSVAVLPVYGGGGDVSSGGNFNRNLPTSKTLGNASRSLINNIRRMGKNKSTFDLSVAAKEFEHSGNNPTTCFRPQQRLRIRSANDDVITTHV